MTTSTLSTPQHLLDGRTVRDIVEYNQELVSESWCRRIIRQLLQSLEVQYGMQMPHRPITADAILVLASGDPMLLADVVAPIDPPLENTEARDLHDLAAVIHYAITLELAPAGPLSGRDLPGYSDDFLAALDRCLFSAPSERPQTIDQMRALLGIAVLAPPTPGPLPPELHEMPVPARPSAPESAPTVASAVAPSVAPSVTPPVAPSAPQPVAASQPEMPAAAPARPTRWLMIGALVVLAAVAALVALSAQNAASDAPPAQEQPAQAAAAPLVAVASSAPAQLEGPVIDETAQGEPLAPAQAQAVMVAPDMTPHPTAVQLAPQGTPPGAAVAGTTYTLAIKPWGSIVVDGVDRGVSPPLKQLTLPPGEHTIGIVNPSFPEHTVTVQSTRGATSTIELDFTGEDKP